MADLTPEEVRFFQTGNAADLTTQPPAPPAPPAPNPVDLAALNNAPPAPPQPATPVPPAAATPAPPAPAPAPDLNLNDPTELLRRSHQEAVQRVAELELQLKSTTTPPAEPPAPDPAVDPLGAMMHRLDQLNKQMVTLQEGLRATQQQSQQANTFTAFQQQVNTMKAEFAKTTPDYDAAASHLRATRIADLRAFGATDAQIAQQLQQEEFSIAAAAVQAGKNPAQVIYEMSKRHGYTPTAAPAPAPGQPPAPAPVASLDAIARAQAAARQLPGAPTPPTEVTLEGLKAMSETDLNKAVMDPALWAQIGGNTQYPL